MTSKRPKIILALVLSSLCIEFADTSWFEILGDRLFDCCGDRRTKSALHGPPGGGVLPEDPYQVLVASMPAQDPVLISGIEMAMARATDLSPSALSPATPHWALSRRL